ncbi:MAG: hypothetical protein NVS2B3_00960 [Vulcanimicrobiaceae bacterium]
MARRGALTPIDLALFADTLARVAGAIALDTFAFVVWNVGTRPPLALVADIRRSFGDRRALATGALAALVGAIFLVAGTVLLVPAIPDPSHELAVVETIAFVVAFSLESSVGEDL